MSKLAELKRRLLMLGPHLEPQAQQDLAWLLAAFEEQEKQMTALRMILPRRDTSLAHYVEDRLSAFDRRLTAVERRFAVGDVPDAEATLTKLVSEVRRLDERVSSLPDPSQPPGPVRSTVPSPVRPPPLPKRVP